MGTPLGRRPPAAPWPTRHGTPTTAFERLDRWLLCPAGGMIVSDPVDPNPAPSPWQPTPYQAPPPFAPPQPPSYASGRRGRRMSARSGSWGRTGARTRTAISSRAAEPSPAQSGDHAGGRRRGDARGTRCCGRLRRRRFVSGPVVDPVVVRRLLARDRQCRAAGSNQRCVPWREPTRPRRKMFDAATIGSYAKDSGDQPRLIVLVLPTSEVPDEIGQLARRDHEGQC